MSNILHHKRNANKNDTEILYQTGQESKLSPTNADKGPEGKGTIDTVGGNVN
jgi:hypothetical protein